MMNVWIANGHEFAAKESIFAKMRDPNDPRGLVEALKAAGYDEEAVELSGKVDMKEAQENGSSIH